MNKIAVLVSGTGSNAINLINKSRTSAYTYNIDLLISENYLSPSLETAKSLGVSTELLEYPKNDKQKFEANLLLCLEKYQINWLLLAGFMRILSKDFIYHFANRNQGKNQIINLHPSYLPHLKGKEAIRMAFEQKINPTGVSLHYVNAEVDEGKIILQRPLYWNTQSTQIEDLKIRVHELEYQLYPQVVEMLCKGELCPPTL